MAVKTLPGGESPVIADGEVLPESLSRRVSLVYVAHMPEGGVFIDQPAVQQAGSSEHDTPDLQGARWAVAKLSIDYPHPDGRKDFGRATVELKPLDCGDFCASKSMTEVRADRLDERHNRYAAWATRWLWRMKAPTEELPPTAVATLDLTRAEIERILRRLEERGHFRRSAEDQGPARLDVMQNQRRISHACEYEPLLDDLVNEVWARGHQQVARMARVQQELQLVGHETAEGARSAAKGPDRSER
jgi:hypothetical protein